jgi:hypothetical protein
MARPLGRGLWQQVPCRRRASDQATCASGGDLRHDTSRRVRDRARRQPCPSGNASPRERGPSDQASAIGWPEGHAVLPGSPRSAMGSSRDRLRDRPRRRQRRQPSSCWLSASSHWGLLSSLILEHIYELGKRSVAINKVGAGDLRHAAAGHPGRGDRQAPVHCRDAVHQPRARGAPRVPREHREATVMGRDSPVRPGGRDVAIIASNDIERRQQRRLASVVGPGD